MSKAQKLVTLLEEKYGDTPQVLTAKQVKEVAAEHGIKTLYKVINPDNKASYGKYHFPPKHCQKDPCVPTNLRVGDTCERVDCCPISAN